MRYLLAAAALAGAAFAGPAWACQIQYCTYTQPVCNLNVVDCSDLSPIWGCTDTVAGPVCLPDPRHCLYSPEVTICP